MFDNGHLDKSELDPQTSHIESLRRNVNHAWNSVFYGRWRRFVPTKASLYAESAPEPDSLIWILGRGYRVQDSTSIASERKQKLSGRSMKTRCPGFYLDYTSRIWLTYRSNFPSIGNTNKISDCGWGCMLRSAQMIVAQALTNIKLGRGMIFFIVWAVFFRP